MIDKRSIFDYYGGHDLKVAVKIPLDGDLTDAEKTDMIKVNGSIKFDTQVAIPVLGDLNINAEGDVDLYKDFDSKLTGFYLFTENPFFDTAIGKWDNKSLFNSDSDKADYKKFLTKAKAEKLIMTVDDMLNSDDKLKFSIKSNFLSDYITLSLLVTDIQDDPTIGLKGEMSYKDFNGELFGSFNNTWGLDALSVRCRLLNLPGAESITVTGLANYSDADAATTYVTGVDAVLNFGSLNFNVHSYTDTSKGGRTSMEQIQENFLTSFSMNDLNIMDIIKVDGFGLENLFSKDVEAVGNQVAESKIFTLHFSLKN